MLAAIALRRLSRDVASEFKCTKTAGSRNMQSCPASPLKSLGLASEMPVFKCATVCASNMNRSMEGHKQLHQSGFKVSSYGVGRMVLLLNFAIFRNISCITALI